MFNGIIASTIFYFAPFLNTAPTAFWLDYAGGSAIPTAILITLKENYKCLKAKL
jgi:hypothetical protein